MNDTNPQHTVLIPREARPDLKAPGEATSGPRSLPRDLLIASAKRLRLVAIVYACAFLLADYGVRILAGEGHTIFSALENWAPAAVAILTSILMVWLTYLPSIPPERLLNIGLVYEVLGSFLIAHSESWGAFNHEKYVGALPDQGVGLSWVAVFVVMFAVVVPNKPWKTLITAILAGMTVPLAWWLTMEFGPTQLTLPTQYFFAGLVIPYLIVAGMAFASSRVFYRLGTDVTKARQMGSYHLLEPIGRGGMGEVWKAKHRMLAREAAIKLVRREVLGAGHRAEAILQRFEREAQATATLRSPHTIELYDFGVTDEGVFYYVMEYLEGMDLHRLVERFGPLPAGRVVHYLQQICHSLAEAHDTGLIHRDVKPGNVFTCRYGREVDFTKVLDFGLVKSERRQEQGDPQLTAADTATGTPAYMAPEQILGDRGIDGRADLYALGCVAYWLLTGRTVFEGDTPMQLAMRHVQDAPIPPSKLTEVVVPEELERIVLDCLEKDPAKRPQTADALLDRLDGVVCEPRWSGAEARQWWKMHMA